MSETAMEFFKKLYSVLPSTEYIKVPNPEIYSKDGIIITQNFEDVVKYLDKGYVAMQSGNARGFIFRELVLGKYMCLYPDTDLSIVSYDDIILNQRFPDSYIQSSSLHTKKELQERFSGSRRYYIIKTDEAFWDLNHFKSTLESNVNAGIPAREAKKAFKNLLLIMRSVSDSGNYESVRDLLIQTGLIDTNTIAADFLFSSHSIFNQNFKELL